MAEFSEIASYVRRGWHVFPCLPKQKTPATKHGFKDATLDEAKIKAWLKENPNYNWAIATGKISNLVVIDVDAPRGSITAVLEAMGEASFTHDPVRVLTGGGGVHLYFAYPDSTADIPSSVNMIKGVDIRADGGYVIVPPSETEGKYEWSF